GRYPTANVPGDSAAHRGTAAAATTSASMRRSTVMRSRATDGMSASECQGKRPDQAVQHRSDGRECREPSTLSHLGFQPVQKTPTIHVSSGFIWGIPVNGSSIFRLTRVTRIFQKKIFTETTLGARAACRAGFFVARAARAAARGGFLVFAEKQENTEETKAMPFQKGQSGNPAGRPRGIVNRATALAQNLLSERAEGIARKVIELAEEGDMAAIRVCMERLVPPIKHQPVAVELPPLEKAADSVEALASIAA